LEDDISFAGWSDEDLRIADELAKTGDPEENRNAQAETAATSKVSWKKTPGLALSSGVMAYEIASNAIPGAPGWLWATLGGAIAIPDVAKAFKAWWRGEDSSDEH
jgi:hypothetical protein